MASWDVGYDAAGSALDFTTIESAVDSGDVATDDTLMLWYSSALKSRFWYVLNYSVSKGLVFVGALPDRAVVIVTGSETGFQFQQPSTLRNVTVSAVNQYSGLDKAVSFEASSGNSYLDKVSIYGGSIGVGILNGGTLTATSCMIVSSSYGFRSFGGPVNVYHCTVVAIFPFYMQSPSSVALLKNTSAITTQERTIFGFASGGSYSASSSNNAANNGETAPGSNPIDLGAVDAKFLVDEIGAWDYRVKSDSALLTAGVDDGVTEDIDGNAISGTFPVGCSNGVVLADQTATPTALAPTDNGDGETWNVATTVAGTDVSVYLYDHSDDSLVAILDTNADTADLTAGVEIYAKALESGKLISGRYPAASGVTVPALTQTQYTDPGVANVKKDETYTFDSVSKTGTYDPITGNYTDPGIAVVKKDSTYYFAGSLLTGTYDPSPDVTAPTLVSVTAGDTQLTLTLSAAGSADVIYARYRVFSSGDWSAESETFKRTGSGDITLTGLTNDVRYEVITYAKETGCSSVPSTPGLATPTDGAVTYPLSEDLKDYLLDAGIADAFGGTEDWAVYINTQPDKPKRVICVYDQSGIRDNRQISDGMVTERPGWQIRVRGLTYPETYNKMYAIMALFDSTLSFTGMSRNYRGIRRDASPIDLGQSENFEFMMTLSGVVTVDK